MRILLLSEFYPPVRGGTEFHVQALAQGLHERGHVVAVGNLNRTASAESAFAVTSMVNTLSHLPRAHKDEHRPFHPPFSDPAIRYHVARLVRSFQPDVIHAHNWIAASVPRNRRAALVVTAHDYGFVCSRRDMFISDERTCDGPGLVKCVLCASQHYGLARGPILAAATPVGRRHVHAEAMIAVSDAVADWLPVRRGAPVHVIPNFVNQTSVDRATREGSPMLFGAEQPYVMFAGATSPAKGHETLVRAWDGGRGFDAGLLLAVLNHHPVMPAPGAVVRELPREDVLRAWRKAAVAVVPSIWPEPCSTSAIEAMLAGVPVVASAVGGLNDLIADGVSGLLVPPGDDQALRVAICKLLDSPDLGRRLGAAGRQRAGRFTGEQVLPQIEVVYEEAVAIRRGPTPRARSVGRR